MTTTIQENLLPTGKMHVSFSEVKQWKECSYRHKLIYIDGLRDESSSPMVEFGSIIHRALEKFLKSGIIDKDTMIVDLNRVWDEKKFDSEEHIILETAKSKKSGYTYEHVPIEEWISFGKKNLDDAKEFLDTNFPGYKVLGIEEYLFDPIEDLPYKFKGFIDAVIEVPDGKKAKTVLIDWKTTGPRGWAQDKKRDVMVQSQLLLYKHFWMQRTGLESKDVKCAFVIIRRIAKGKTSFSLLEVSAGPTSRDKATKVLRDMISGVLKGRFLKNRNSCKYCPFLGTSHCT